MKRHFKWDRTYLHWGVTAFCVIAASVLLFSFLQNIDVVRNTISKVVRILAPFIWGVVICYLLSPMMSRMERRLFLPFCKKLYSKSKRSDGSKIARGLSVLVSEIILLLMLVAIVYLILPQMFSSIQTLVSNSGTYVNNLTDWVGKLLANYPDLEDYVSGIVGNVGEDMGAWLEGKLLPQLGNMVTSVTSGVYGVALSIYNLVIGIIVSVYLLMDKENFLATIKRLSYTVFSVETADKLRLGMLFVDRTFMGFLTGKLLDSLIIGIICYIVCSILRMPYTLLVSVIIGITNIIPFFGPLIGAIPSALIILMVDPVKCLVFVIFIIILQQIDGNIIGPHILGSSTGITGFWVMFSIILGSGLFGFWVMLLGVPVFVVIYNFFNKLIVRKLQRNDLPYEISDYRDMEYIDPSTMQVIKKPDVRKEELAREKAAKAAADALQSIVRPAQEAGIQNTPPADESVRKSE